MIFLIILSLLYFYKLRQKRWQELRYRLNVYFGVPGSGKTTFAAWLVSEANRISLSGRFAAWLVWHWPFYNAPFPFLRHNFVSEWIFNHTKLPYKVWSNVPITGAYEVDPKVDLGFNMVENGRLIIDEAGVEYNNRSYKSLSAEAIYFFKYHRHYRLAVDVLSQSYDDMDITLRRLAYGFFVVRRSLIPGFVVLKGIRRSVGVDSVTQQIIDAYKWGFPILDTKWIYAPRLYKLFNSYSTKDLPVKDFKLW